MRSQFRFPHDTTHFIEGVPYSLEEGDIVLLQPTILHLTEYPAGPPSKRLIISFWYPKDLFGMADYYLPLLSIFNAQIPILSLSRGNTKTDSGHYR